MIGKALRKLTRREDLTLFEAEAVFSDMLHGLLSPVQIAGLLVGLATKGESIDEIAGAATVMKGMAVSISPKRPHILDIVGTGGDNLRSFNISTTVAFVVAGGGVTVAKHGNRSVSSSSGSADVFELLGIKLDISPEEVKAIIEKVGIGFLYAPLFHPALKHVMPVRKELQARTIFNILGPLVNPAGAEAQLVGVYDQSLIEKVAHVLGRLGVKRAFVVHGSDGMDEMTLTGKSFSAHLHEGKVILGEIDPNDYGFSYCDPKDLIGGSPAENTEILMNILTGEEDGPKRDIILLNAGTAFFVSGKAKDIGEGIALAKKSIDSGAAMMKLKELQNAYR